jgi:pyruvate-formate lyase-activating enzyme/SAM-dependent methyltransferase
MSPQRPTRRAIVKLAYACNNGCVFCHSSDRKQLPGLTTEEAQARIEQARDIGAQSVLFSGGEPTLRRDLPELATTCRQLGMRFGLITNGRMLGYPPLVRRLLDSGLEYAYLSLHGPTEIHDRLVRVPGAFSQTLAGARLLAGRGLHVTLAAVVVEDNLDSLPALADIAASLSDVRLKFTLVEPKGAALDGAAHPDPVRAATAVGAALERAARLGIPAEHIGVDGFPHCLDPRFPSLQDDLHTHGVFAIREVDEQSFFPIDYANMIRPGPCRGCRLSDDCKGTWKGTISRFGDAWLRPLRGGISNSFNYFPMDEADPTEHIDSSRLLLLRDPQGPEGISWFMTDSGDFPSDELARIRDARGQVYLQIDDEPLVTDFPRQLRKLVVHSSGGTLPPVRTPLDKDVFSQAEESVREILEQLSGNVLDVGCGDLRFLPLLERKLDAGDLRYTAVDPCPGPEVRRLARGGRITLIEQPVENLLFERGIFDHVLLLRSHNHLADPWTAYSLLLGALRWQGSLLVVDNVAFGLVRHSRLRSAVDAIPAACGFEHLRNDDSTAVADRLCRWFPLTTIRRTDVTPESANQWLLLFRKQWPSGGSGQDTYPALSPQRQPAAQEPAES